MNDLFTPRTSFTCEQLHAYAMGSMPPAQQHGLELLMEESLLHAEAVEGYRSVPDASPTVLDRHRPGRSGNTWWLAGGGALLVVGAVILIALPSPEDPATDALGMSRSDTHDPAPATVAVISEDEFASAHDLPESLQIGHEPMDEKPPVLAALRDASGPPLPLEPRVIEPRHAGNGSRDQQLKTAPRPSRHCVFLHDLKVVHPDELYPERSPMFYQTGVPANQGASVNERVPPPNAAPTQQKIDTAAWNRALRDSEPKVSYLDFMDHALGAFFRSQHALALEELRYLLTQFPDDVNALFYCGLSAYNMGLTSKAAAWFQRARDHKVDTFSEEADWYRALCIEQLYGKSAAEKEYVRIGAAGGFYSAKAKDRLAAK